MRLTIVSVIVALAAQTPLRADAWARGRGATYVHLGLSSLSSTRAFDETGERVPFPGRGASRTRAAVYAELGLNDTFTLVASLPYEKVTSRGLFNDFTTAGGSDFDLRLRVSRKTNRGAIAFEGGAFIPLGYDRLTFPQLGTGVVEPVINAAYAMNVAALPDGFLSLQAGYRMRGGGLSDELPYTAKLGAFFHPRIGTFISLRGWESRGDFRNVEPTFALTVTDSEQLAAAAEIYLRILTRLDINASWSRAIRGRNSAIGNEWSVGLAMHVP